MQKLDQKDAVKMLEWDWEKQAPYLALLQAAFGKVGKSSCLILARDIF